jgi:hypothetical protein
LPSSKHCAKANSTQHLLKLEAAEFAFYQALFVWEEGCLISVEAFYTFADDASDALKLF